jgi:sugar lactone lactonase YvrE
MTALHFELVAEGFGSLEGPAFGQDGTLYVGDLKEGAVFSLAPNGRVERLLRRSHVGGILLHRSGGLVLSGESVVHWTTTGVRELLDVEGVRPVSRGRAIRFNDLVAEPGSGAVVAGVLCADEGGAPSPGQLVRIDAVGRFAVVFDGLHPNGLAYSADGSQLIAADTYGRRVVVLDTASDGSLSVSNIIPTDAINGLPDGIATDTEGGVWVAFYRGACIARFDAATGQASVHPFPATKPLSLSFGRPDTRELVVVTGRDPSVGEVSGTVWRARTTVAGAPVAEAAI